MNTQQRHDAAARFVEEWAQLPLRGRVLLAVYMVIGAFGGLIGADSVLAEFTHSWIGWAVSLIVLEPVGLACALGLFVLIFPRSRIAGWFCHALGRAKVAAVVVGLIFVSAILSCLTFFLYEFWKTL